MTPAQEALWINAVQRRCLEEANGDVEAALAATEYIVTNFPPSTLEAVFTLQEGDPPQEETEADLLYGMPEVFSEAASIINGDAGMNDDDNDDADEADDNKKKHKRRHRRLLKALRMFYRSLKGMGGGKKKQQGPVPRPALSTDASGHEHDELGRFTEKARKATHEAYNASSELGWDSFLLRDRVNGIPRLKTIEEKIRQHRIAAVGHEGYAATHEGWHMNRAHPPDDADAKTYVSERGQLHLKAKIAHKKAQQAHEEAAQRYEEYNALLAIDIHGREHRGKGKDGGQFVKKGAGNGGEPTGTAGGGGPDQRGGRAGDGAAPPHARRGVEAEAERPDHAGIDTEGQGEGESAGAGTPEATDASAVEPTTPTHTISTTRAIKRLTGYRNYFRSKKMDQMADLMDMVRKHIKEIGAERAAEILGAEKPEDTNYKQVQYQTTGYLDEKDRDIKFMRKYLEESGIKLQTLGHYDPSLPLITAAPIPEAHARKREGDIVPLDSALEDKLEESKFIPGLESTEDVNQLIGRPVHQITKDVAAKFDEKYGKGKWIIKSYGDESYAGFGILFAERCKAIQRGWKEEAWDAARILKKRGFTIEKDNEGNTIGVKGRNTGLLRFGTDEPDSIQDPEAREQVHRLSVASQYEKGARLPQSPEDSVQQEFGVRLVRDPANKNKITGITGLDGKFYKRGSKEMENYLDEVGGGSLYAHLDVKRAIESAEDTSYVSKVGFMVQPAHPTVGSSEELRALGSTWEFNTEGRVHVVVKDGKARVVPYATLPTRESSLPAVFLNDDLKAMERAAQEAVDALPEQHRANRVFAPDVMKTKNGWKVVEMNTSATTGSSGWLEENQFVIDAYVAAVTGRAPQHVNFIRRILQGEAKLRNEERLAKTRPTTVPSKTRPTTIPSRRGGRHGAKLAVEGPPINRTWEYTPQSSWVHSYKQRQNRDGDTFLVVRFKDRHGRITAACHYEDQVGTLYRGMEDAISKGKYTNQALYYLPYDLGNKYLSAEDQPRMPAGIPEGGQFASKGQAGATRRVKLGRLKVAYSTYRPVTHIKGPSLKLTNYKQQDFHSCGFVAALTIARYYTPDVDDTKVLDAARASVNYGVNRSDMRKGLKKLGIHARHQLELTIPKLKNYLKRGIPVIVSVWPDQWEGDHWTIVQGIDEEKGRIHLTNHYGMTIDEFKREWSKMDEPVAGREGLVCVPEGEDPNTFDYHKWKGKKLSAEFEEKHPRDEEGKFTRKQERATTKAHDATDKAYSSHDAKHPLTKQLNQLIEHSANIEMHQTHEQRGKAHQEAAELHEDFINWHKRKAHENPEYIKLIKHHEKAKEAHEHAAEMYGITKPAPESEATPEPAPKPSTPDKAPSGPDKATEPESGEAAAPTPPDATEGPPGPLEPEPPAIPPDKPARTPSAPYRPHVTIRKHEERVFTGKTIHTIQVMSKIQTRRLGEAIITAHLQQAGHEDARPMNYGHADYPIDLIYDHESVEVKTGVVSNKAKSQHWRSTIGTPGRAEQKMLANMTPAEKRAWNRNKQARIAARKEAVLKQISEELGHEVKAKTYGLIINPDAKTADIYEFDGLHERIGWNSPEAERAYKGTVKYEQA